MFDLICKKFIDNYQDYQNNVVREKYGTLCSYISIICNIILVIFKLIIGLITNSIAIQADALNNLSDVGSNVASLLGFKLANRHADEEHPYGHGRYEYIAGLIISFLIILVGLQLLKDSFLKILNPEKVIFSNIAVIILVISILIKLWMFFFNNKTGELIGSATLKAAGRDSINDVIATSATLLALFLTLVTDLPVDGIFGCLVSLIILKAGIDVFRDTVDPILGRAPDKELILEIEKFIMTFEKPIGIHDLMMHDYGPGRQFLTLHVEVDSRDDIMAIHDEMDVIERSINDRYHILTTIHMDPVECDNQVVKELKELTLKIVKSINESYSIHDFRIVIGNTHTNFIFDVLIPSSDQINHNELKRMISDKLQEVNPTYFTVINIDHAFV